MRLTPRLDCALEWELAFPIQRSLDRVCSRVIMCLWPRNKVSVQIDFLKFIWRFVRSVTSKSPQSRKSLTTCRALLSSICGRTCILIVAIFPFLLAFLRWHTVIYKTRYRPPKHPWHVASPLVLNLTWLLDICRFGLILTLLSSSWHFITRIYLKKSRGRISVSGGPKSP